MPPQRHTRSGFTLTEMMIAISILMVAMGLALTGYVHIWSETNKGMTQDELDVQVQVSIEKIKRDLRLSALEKIYYYPEGPGAAKAISMPLARDDDGDGAVDVDTDGKIIWDRTVIYHVWSGNPNQLRMTTIDPRDNSLTATQLQAQLNSVATIGNASATFGSTNATTQVIFQNLFDWHVLPQSSTYDGYASSMERDLGVVLGSAVMSNGSHTLEFRVAGKNPSASNYQIGLDSLFMSPSYSVREAEAQLPATGVVGPSSPSATYMAAGSWSGNYQLHFPATAVGNRFTLTLNNDRWEETNFRSTGELHTDSTVRFDTSLSPNDWTVQLDGGYGVNWRASTQIGTSFTPSENDRFRGCAVRVLIRGRNIDPGGAIENVTSKVFAYMRAGSNPLNITDIFIAEANVDASPSMDATAGTMTRLRTSGGANGWNLGANSGVYFGFPATFRMDTAKSYLLTFLVNAAVNSGSAALWAVSTNTTYVGSYIATNSPTAADAMADTWSTRSDVYVTNAIVGLELVWGTYLTNGIYTSAVFDTQRTTPAYTTIGWNSVVPFSTSLGIKVRSAHSNDMSDAASWTNVATMSSPGAINPGNKRYIQFQAVLNSSGTYSDVTPKLRDVTISWPGETKIVDIGGTFTKGPAYGIFEMLLDGQPLKKGVVVNLEIFDYARAHGTSNRITSAATTEVTPRNSGR